MISLNTKVVSKQEMNEIIETLKSNQVVAFPTETVFGLGAMFNSLEALDQLVKSKHRDASKAITLMVSDVLEIENYAYVTSRDWKIIHSFMPGKITLILNKKENVSKQMTSNKETIGIRIPDDEFVLSLLKKTGPLLVTSANMSGSINTTSVEEVLNQLEGKIPLIVEGKSGSHKASTVVDLSKDKIKILREGDISLAMIEEVLK